MVQNYIMNVWNVPEVVRNLFSIGHTTKIEYSLKADQNGCLFTKDSQVRKTDRKKKTEKKLFVFSNESSHSKISAEV